MISKLVALGIFPAIWRRLAADTAALINGTTAQALYVYNTFTSDTVYERGFFRWAANVLEIGNEHVGGSNRITRIFGPNTIRLNSGGTDRITVGNSSFAPTTDAGVSCGTSSARFSNGHFSTYVRTHATTVTGLVAAATAGAGARAFVTDANATTFMSTVAGGGSNAVPVVSDGTNWKIG